MKAAKDVMNECDDANSWHQPMSTRDIAAKRTTQVSSDRTTTQTLSLASAAAASAADVACGSG